MPHPLASFDPENWLRRFFLLGQQQRFCVSMYCTTCGATDFRRRLWAWNARAMGRRQPFGKPRTAPIGMDEAQALARALAGLRREELAGGEWPNDAMMITLLDIQLAIQPFTMKLFIAPLLGDSWAGRTLAAMLEHHAERVTERREQRAYESPDAAQTRRDEKKRLKAEAHAARLAAKKERDRDWWARNPKP